MSASPSDPSVILAGLASGHRPDRDGWVTLAERAGLDDLMAAAHRYRMEKDPDPVVGYVVDRNINYSNVCAAVCTFCAFFRKPGSVDGYVLSYTDIFKKVEEMIALGGSGILLQGGLHPDLPFSYYTDLLRELKRRYRIYLHCFSPPEIWFFAETFNLPVREVLRRLRDAGLDSIPGGGAEILVDEIRRMRATKCTGVQWIQVMEEAHRQGIATTATMMFGIGESKVQRVMHLEMLRELQARTGGFLSFIPWTFQPDNTALGKKIPDRVSDEEYLRWLAVCRLFLDNIRNLQVSWLTHGVEVGGRALRGGANDIGSIMIEENVISPAGAHHRAQEATLRRAITEAGFIPRQRNAGYIPLEGTGQPEALPLPGGPRPVISQITPCSA